jgi:hypothetical protein
MTIDRRLLAGTLGLALVLAACGGTSTASSGTSAATVGPTDAATEAPAATEEPTEGVATEEPASEAPTADSGSGAGQVNGLAAMLPEKAGDLTFERVGYDGDQLGIFGAAAGLNSEELDPILKANGKTINDINFAIATATGGAGGAAGTGGMIYAIQVEGLDAATFAASMGMDPSSMPKTTLGGKTVYGEAASGFGAFAYPKDDKLFIVLLMDEETAASVFEQLP